MLSSRLGRCFLVENIDPMGCGDQALFARVLTRVYEDRSVLPRELDEALEWNGLFSSASLGQNAQTILNWKCEIRTVPGTLNASVHRPPCME